MYALLLTRKNWADIESAGATVYEMLVNAYTSTPTQAADALHHVRTIRTETWTYEPRLALIPGRPLEPSLPSINLVKRTWTMGLRDVLRISGVICPLVIVRTYSPPRFSAGQRRSGKNLNPHTKTRV